MTFFQITKYLSTKVSKFENKQSKIREVSSREKKKFTKISGNKSSEINTLTKEGVSLKMYIVETNTSTQETEELKNEDGSIPIDAGTQFGELHKKGNNWLMCSVLIRIVLIPIKKDNDYLYASINLEFCID